jgi:sirohydrochlorin cobaltochelatase
VENPTNKRALVLFSHGSLLCGSGEALEAHAARLRERGDFDLVSLGYLNYSEPKFAEAVELAASAGITEIVVVPYFLVPGFFITKSLPEAVAQAQAQFPRLSFTVAPPLGDDASLVDALLDAAQNARGREHWRDPLTRAALACRPSPDCPLYGTPACPKVPELPNA